MDAADCTRTDRCSQHVPWMCSWWSTPRQCLGKWIFPLRDTLSILNALAQNVEYWVFGRSHHMQLCVLLLKGMLAIYRHFESKWPISGILNSYSSQARTAFLWGYPDQDFWSIAFLWDDLSNPFWTRIHHITDVTDPKMWWSVPFLCTKDQKLITMHSGFHSEWCIYLVFGRCHKIHGK